MSKNTALITGATSLLGERISICLAGIGYDLILCGQREERLKDVKHRVCNGFPERSVLTVMGSLEKEKDTDAIIDVAGRCSLAVNAAGFSKLYPFKIIELEDIWRMFAVNVFAPMKIAQKIFPLDGIINVVSLCGLYGFRESAGYCASKHAVMGWSKALRKEYDVPVSTICTGNMNNEMKNSETYLTVNQVAMAVLFCAQTKANIDIEMIHPEDNPW